MISAIRKCNLVRQVHTNNFTIQKVKPADRKEVLRLMLEVFYKTEPSSIYTGVATKSTLSPLLQKMTLEPLDEDLSFIVKANDKDDHVAGVIINASRPTVMNPEQVETMMQGIECHKEQALLELWKFVALIPQDPKDLFGDEDKLLELRYMAVDKRYTRRGLGTSLVKTSRKEAVDRGFKFIRMDCTSDYTARIASEIGLRCIFSLNYKDYRNKEGEKVFDKVIPPHTKIHIFVGESVS